MFFIPQFSQKPPRERVVFGYPQFSIDCITNGYNMYYMGTQTTLDHTMIFRCTTKLHLKIMRASLKRKVSEAQIIREILEAKL